MATRREQVEAVIDNENMRKILDLIAAVEGVKHGYNTGFGNTVLDSLADHPRESKGFTQTDGQKRRTTAAGRYQFLESTWDEEAKRLKLPDFGERSQDMAAISRIIYRGALDDVLNGDFEAAIKKLGVEWAGMPSSNYAQPKKSWDFATSFLNSRGVETPAMADTSKPMTTQSANDWIEGTFAAYGARQQPVAQSLETANPFDAVRFEQQQAQDDQLLDDMMSYGDSFNRQNAVAAFFNEPAQQAQTRLPRQIEAAIQRELSRIG